MKVEGNNTSFTLPASFPAWPYCQKRIPWSVLLPQRKVNTQWVSSCFSSQTPCKTLLVGPLCHPPKTQKWQRLRTGKTDPTNASAASTRKAAHNHLGHFVCQHPIWLTETFELHTSHPTILTISFLYDHQMASESLCRNLVSTGSTVWGVWEKITQIWILLGTTIAKYNVVL